MSFSITTEFSPWWIFICLLFSLAVVYFLYRGYKLFQDLKKWQKYLLFSLRFLFVFFLTFFLLSPLIRNLNRNIMQPLIVIAQDNSRSIKLTKDSTLYTSGYKNDLNNLISSLGQDYEVMQHDFGSGIFDTISFNFSDNQTNISELFDLIEKKYFNRNIGALILSSDGIYNNGYNPAGIENNLKYPVYAIAMGDTNVHKDIILAEVLYNKIAFLGNKFPIKISFDIQKLKTVETELQIIKNNEILFSKKIKATSDNYSEEVYVEIDANAVGLQYYNVYIKPVDGEVSTKNNIMKIAVDVIDGKQKILILSNSPHPDIAALKNAIATNLNFQTDHFNINDFKGKPDDYNLIIMHQIPSSANAATPIFQQIFTKKIPVILILGSQSDIKKLNSLSTGLQIIQRKPSYEESVPVTNKDFSVFTTDNLPELTAIATPLITLFAEYKINPGVEVLFYQKIRNINTNKPLFLFNKLADHKIGIITGEGIWKWRLYERMNNGNSENFDILINKIIQYLALKVNKEKFIIDTKRIFSETENILFNAELYNENFELINDPDVTLDIYDENDDKYSYQFSKTNNAYQIDAGRFPKGKYRYDGKTEVNKKKSTYKGEFIVVESNVEEANIIANHKLLFNLSLNSGGEIFYPDQISEIYNTIKKNENIKAISYIEKDIIELINIKWIFFVLLFIICLEWLLRKLYGSS